MANEAVGATANKPAKIIPAKEMSKNECFGARGKSRL